MKQNIHAKKHAKGKKKRFWLRFPLNWIMGCIVLAYGIAMWGISHPQQLATKQVCANSISCINNTTAGKIAKQETIGVFEDKKVTVPKQLLVDKATDSGVLGVTTGANKRIYVDLTNQRLYAFEDNRLVFNFYISSGWWNKTPTGTFSIWVKLRSTRMTGGSGADYYDLPNVPYTMYFYNDQVGKSLGYSLHGAYWHNRFGHPMSHGCVNIAPDNAEKLYDWATPTTDGFTTYATDDNPGTKVIIFGDTPNDPPVYE